MILLGCGGTRCKVCFDEGCAFFFVLAETEYASQYVDILFNEAQQAMYDSIQYSF